MHSPTPLTLSPAEVGALPSPDEILRRERGQAWVRVAVCTVVAGYLFVGSQPEGWIPTWWGAYLAVAVVFALRISSSIRWFWVRRLLFNVGDVATITYLMVVTGDVGIPLFVLYLWITLGNGFRFGTQALATSAMLSVIGFMVVIAMNQVWQHNPRFSIGVVLALVLLPIAAANLIHRLTFKKHSGLAEKPPRTDFLNGVSKTVQGIFPPTNDVILRRERGQAMLRVIVTVVATLCVAGASWPVSVTEPPMWLVLGISYFLLAVFVLFLVFRSTRSPSWRRYAANVCDISVISGGLYAAGLVGMPLFALYLWVTLGVGFRFGVRPLLVSAGLSLAALCDVYLVSPVWQANPTYFVGAVSALVLSTFAAWRLIRRLSANRDEESIVRREQSGNLPILLSDRFSGWVQTISNRLQARSSPSRETLGRERGQAILRVVVSGVVTLYLALTLLPQELGTGIPFWFVFAVSYVVFGAGLVWHIRHSGSSPATRRFLGNLADTCAISYVMIGAQESAMPLFALYLWVTFGNGFRYGVSALMVSSALSVIGFAVVVALTPAWQSHTALVVGVFVSLVVLPLYTGHLLQMLNAALTKANEANAVKSQFLARMSHELRTPLNGIRGSVELLRGSRRLLPDERALLDVIDESVSVSLRQIDNVLDFSKLEAGKLSLEQTDFDLHALINSTVAMVRPAAAQKRLRLLVRIAPTTPFFLVGDGHHLRAILLNLLSNALKFTEQGFVCVDVMALEEKAERTKVRFEVLDTGIGIASNALTRIFDSFSQEDTGTTRRYGGTGLGTTIAKQLVELMGGQIGVQSIKGRGTLFWFELPFPKQAQPLRVQAPSHATTLLVSADADLEAGFQRLLPQQLLLARSEEAALELITRALRLGNPVHLVLVDQALSLSASGDHRLAELAERASVTNLPLIWISDEPPPPDKLREWGYAATLARSPSPASLQAALHASPYSYAGVDTNVVSIAPWVWDERGGDRPKILVADDNQTNLMITRRMLERAGYDVDTVSSGDDAAERLMSGRYRLAVLDMHMPGLDGPDVARQYRTLRPRSPLPIIVLTANASMAAQQACAEAGADAYLAKPVTSRKLLSEVKRLLDETVVEVLPLKDARRAARSNEPNDEVIDVSVLAELDRIYRDPDELRALVLAYEQEGQDVLRRLAAVCNTRNHAAFCDIVHALKSNAANVGARQLMEKCRAAGAVSLVEFIRQRNQLLHDLEAAFVASVSALHSISAAASDGRPG